MQIEMKDVDGLEEVFEDAVSDLSELIKIDSVRGEPFQYAPFGMGPKKALDFMVLKASSEGFVFGNVDGYAGYAEMRATDPNAETLGVLTHLDVVPIGFGWTKEQGSVSKGRIWGRGAIDNKGPLLACFHALRLMRMNHKQPSLKRNIRLIWGCNEESGNECMDYYSQKIGMPEIGFSPDAEFPIITCEKTILQLKLEFPLDTLGVLDWSAGSVTNAVPSQSILKLSKEHKVKAVVCLHQHPNWGKMKEDDDGNLIITSQGRSAHAMTPHLGDNAAWKSAWILFDILDTSTVTPLKKFINSFCTDSALEHLGIARKDIESGFQTMNVGKIELLDNMLTVYLDFRCPISQDIDRLKGIIKGSVPGCTMSTLYHAPYLYLDHNSELVRSLSYAYSKATGHPAKYIISGGGTYARKMKNCVAFGPMIEGIDNHIHDADEFIDLEHLKSLIVIYYTAMLHLAT